MKKYLNLFAVCTFFAAATVVYVVFTGMNPSETGGLQIGSIVVAWVVLVIAGITASKGNEAVVGILLGVTLGTICGNAVYDPGTTFWVSFFTGLVGLVLAGLNADAFR